MIKALRISSLVVIAAALSACGGSNSESTSSQSNIASAAFENAVSISQTQSVEELNTSSTECGQHELDQEILEAINTIRASGRSCGAQFYAAVQPVTWNCKLESAALSHSIDMAENNFFSHSGSDGLRVNHRVDETNYDWMAVAENIAAGYPGVDLVMQAWLDSPSHCAALMGENYEEVGVAIELSESSDYDDYWTLVLAKPAT